MLSHAVCGGDADLQNLQIIQSVMTTVVSSDTGAFDLIQRFRDLWVSARDFID